MGMFDPAEIAAARTREAERDVAIARDTARVICDALAQEDPVDLARVWTDDPTVVDVTLYDDTRLRVRVEVVRD